MSISESTSELRSMVVQPPEKSDVSYSDLDLLAGARSAGAQIRQLNVEREQSRTRSITTDVNIALVTAIVIIISAIGIGGLVFVTDQVQTSLINQAETQIDGLSILVSEFAALSDTDSITNVVDAYLQADNTVAVRITEASGDILYLDISENS